MCGLFGFYSGAGFVRQAELYSLLSYFMSFRGDHSFGVSVLGPDDHIRIYRGLGDIVNASEMRRKLAKATSIQGHTRYATVGEISIANCHPFAAKHLLVAHNGGIWNHESIGKADRKTYDVDSQALAWRLAMRRPIEDLYGYGSVSVLDTLTAEHRICRMSGGELVTFRVIDLERDGEAYCYASSWNSGTWYTSTRKQKNMRETLELFGFRVDCEDRPGEGEVKLLSAEGILETDERIELGEDVSPRGTVDWRSWYNGTDDDDLPDTWSATRRRVRGHWRHGAGGWKWVEGTSSGSEINDATGALDLASDESEDM